MVLTNEEASRSSSVMKSIVNNIETVILGKRDVVEKTVMALVCGGHVLLEDVPGVGKTTLVSALAKSIDCGFNRIQFTPDVMPSDVTGFSVFNQKTSEFDFRPGGVMSNIILADEINRASAKTQSSLLEAMEEKQVTVDGKTYKLAEPFMVLATQNPLEQYGTYPLPEAQTDRFLMKLSIGYPDFNEEQKMLELGDSGKASIRPVVRGQHILALRQRAEAVRVSPGIAQYIVQIITATRNSSELKLGSSPRGSIALYKMARVKALYEGRNYVIPDDVKEYAPDILAHRVMLGHGAKSNKREARMIISDILGTVIAPV